MRRGGEIFGQKRKKSLTRIDLSSHLFVREKPDGDLKGILREVPLVPESTPLRDLWRTMSDWRSYMAVIFDEHGGTVGIVTVEDLIEEVFGEVGGNCQERDRI